MTDAVLVVVSALDVWFVFWWGEATWDLWLIGAGVLALMLNWRIRLRLAAVSRRIENCP